MRLSEMIAEPNMTKYGLSRLGRNVSLHAPHERETWHIVKSVLLEVRELSWEQLSIACRDHTHPAGGEAFISHMLNKNWIEVV
jgi:hypothetical protein